jgi:1-aminocyclopropane-1-carboxylate deaminase/D-cysteine desulfhydrase-like pyridoxal-dependent ACC family enzyme
MATALATLMSLPSVPLAAHRTPIDRLTRLEAALGSGCPTLLIKRDDLLPFALGGNKVRKMQLVAAAARDAGADTLITCGAVQSNHARVTAAAGAVMGWRVILVLSGAQPQVSTGNLRLDYLFGAEVRFVARRDEREPAMRAAAAEVTASGGHPYIVPLGASMPIGAIGMARAVTELSAAGVKPDVIVHASSSGGTQAGLVAGCALVGLRARVLGISADEPSVVLARQVTGLLDGMAALLGSKPESVGADRPVEIDDAHVGDGYGIPTKASIETTTLLARREGLVLDPVYTAKAMTGLVAHVRAGAIPASATVLFWHTGGLNAE